MTTYEEYIKRRSGCRKIRKHIKVLFKKVREMETQKATILAVSTSSSAPLKIKTYSDAYWDYNNDVVHFEEHRDTDYNDVLKKAEELKRVLPHYSYVVFIDDVPVPRKFHKPKNFAALTKTLMNRNNVKNPQ